MNSYRSERTTQSFHKHPKNTNGLSSPSMTFTFRNLRIAITLREIVLNSLQGEKNLPTNLQILKA
jgi:hypothetical protein